MWRRAVLASAWFLLLAMGCSDDDGSGGGDRTCGDSVCSQATCETQTRCPEDCGTCIGDPCDSGGSVGQCGEPCTSSCDCFNQGELCTADYGVAQGSCVPVACLSCENFESCSYVMDADGACPDVTCI
jgi:hypothetical protein